MNKLESINRLLTVSALLLDEAAAEISRAKLEPVRENIEHIGQALVEIMEIQQHIFKLQPNLTPEYLAQPTGHTVANRRLTEYMYKVSEFEIAGNNEQAIAILQEYLELETSPLHRDIAIGEIERLQSTPDS